MELDDLRERLTERTVLSPMHDDGGNPIGAFRTVPCVCAKDRKPCTYHEGVEAGVDAVLDVLVPAVDWCDTHNSLAPPPRITDLDGCVVVPLFRIAAPMSQEDDPNG